MDSQRHATEEQKARNNVEQQESDAWDVETLTNDAGLVAMSAFLRGPNGRFRGNSSPRAGAMLSLQRAIGNRATLRSVQRDLFDGWKLGDWQIKPPGFKGETDDKYDTPENRRRAEQQEADERGESQTPSKWWEQPKFDPKAPPPWMPKINTKEQEPPIIIPPKPPDTKGDYPLPPWPEGEGYA